jgi:hypothetical protein
MRHEVRSIPPAPRRVRLRPLLAHRWPLLLGGFALAIVGGLVTWMLFLAAGGKASDQRRLDAGPRALARGSVTGADAPVTWDGRQWQYTRYTWTWNGSERIGAAFAAAGQYPAGTAVEVEYLADEPRINRIPGTLLHVDVVWLRPETWLGAVVVPGALLLLGWLAGVFQLRHVLVHGDASIATLVEVRRVRGVLPEMLRVRYEFRDHHAVPRRGCHWVRVHSELGERLERQQTSGWFEPMPVLHDRRLPQWSRILLPADFLPAGDATPAGIGEGSPQP